MISEVITKRFIQSSIIEEEQYDLYQYGISSFLGNILNILSTLVIGILCGEFFMSLIFLIIMIPLRSSIGGCHLKSAAFCFVASCGLVVLCLLLPRFIINYSLNVIVTITNILLGIIVIIAPVDCISKPMLIDEKREMHRRVRWIAIFIEIVFIVAMVLGEDTICIEICLMCTYALVTLAIEKIRKRAKRHG